MAVKLRAKRVISASRRTDIPMRYTRWLAEKIGVDICAYDEIRCQGSCLYCYANPAIRKGTVEVTRH